MFNILAMQELAQLLENNSKLFQSSTLTAEQALTSIDKLYIRLQELRSDEEFQRLFTKISGLAGVKSLEVARAAKRKRVTPRGTTDFVAHSQAPIESTDIGERNALQANFYEAIDATSQAIKDRFDQEDLKKLMKINKCLIGAANKESSKEDAKDELACISDLIDLDTLKEELQELPGGCNTNQKNNEDRYDLRYYVVKRMPQGMPARATQNIAAIQFGSSFICNCRTHI